VLARRPALAGSTKLPNAAHSLPSARQFVLAKIAINRFNGIVR
jgi:hypothetical protein